MSDRLEPEGADRPSSVPEPSAPSEPALAGPVISPALATEHTVRPTTVTVAARLQLAIVLVLLLGLAAAVAEAFYYDAAIDRVAARTGADPTEVSDERTGSIIAAVGIGAFLLFFAGWLAACVVPLRRGRNVARILTFVASGLQLLVCAGPVGCGMLFFPLIFLLPPAPFDPETGEPIDPFTGEPFDPETGEPIVPGSGYGESEFFEQLQIETLTFTDLSFVGFSVLSMVVFGLSVAVVVLLLTPSSNRFFARRQPDRAWPPTGHWYGPGYAPGYGYGHAPGYGYPPGYAPWYGPGHGYAPGHAPWYPPGYGYGPAPWPGHGWAPPQAPAGYVVPPPGPTAPTASQTAPTAGPARPVATTGADTTVTGADPSTSAADQIGSDGDAGTDGGGAGTSDGTTPANGPRD